jgi:hypothetical protein
MSTETLDELPSSKANTAPKSQIVTAPTKSSLVVPPRRLVIIDSDDDDEDDVFVSDIPVLPTRQPLAQLTSANNPTAPAAVSTATVTRPSDPTSRHHNSQGSGSSSQSATRKKRIMLSDEESNDDDDFISDTPPPIFVPKAAVVAPLKELKEKENMATIHPNHPSHSDTPAPLVEEWICSACRCLNNTEISPRLCIDCG